MHYRVHGWTGLALAVLLAACGADGPPTAPGPQTTGGGTMAFNPQPEPPPLVVELTATGLIDGSWTGRLGERLIGYDSELTIRTTLYEVTGGTVGLRQLWTFVPPEPIVPPEPVLPVVLELQGIANLATGSLVLNGALEDGPPVHVRGMLTSAGGGGLSILGEVMFNPQPEPPPLTE